MLQTIGDFAHSNPLAARIITAILVILLLFGIDAIANWGKIYVGVHIGSVDVSGMTHEQALEAVNDQYLSSFETCSIAIYGDQATADRAASGEDVFSEVAYDEDSTSSYSAWQVDATSLSATFDAEQLVQQALDYGHGLLSLPARISSLISGTTISLDAQIPEDTLSSLCGKINEATGDERIDFGVTVQDGSASVVEGHSGLMVNQDEMSELLTDALYGEGSSSFVAPIEQADSRTSEEQAQEAADLINDAIDEGATLVYGDQQWSVSSSELGAWVVAEVVQDGNGYRIDVHLDADKGQAAMLDNVTDTLKIQGGTVTFEKGDDGSVIVHCASDSTMPDIESAVESLSDTLFVDKQLSSAPTVTVEDGTIPESTTFSEAKALGLVTKISSYTTDFTEDDENRNFNIKHMADLIDESICEAGGEWSMLSTSGEISESTGWASAGTIVDGEVVDDYGGGVCQVATTVFNCVYEAGFPFAERHNHTMYMSSYPDGRDAAISYPDLDLRWDNDTDSDVLLVTSYTDSSVTVELWGVDPCYEVETETGEWKTEDDYQVVVKYDSDVDKNTYYISTYGTEGSSIQITRYVYNADGSERHSETFTSEYDPVNEVVVFGGDGTTSTMKYESYLEFLEKWQKSVSSS